MMNNLKLFFGRWSRIIILAIVACFTLWFLLNFGSFLNKAKEFKKDVSLIQNSLQTTSSTPNAVFSTNLSIQKESNDKLKNKVSVTPSIKLGQVTEQSVTTTPIIILEKPDKSPQLTKPSMTPTPSHTPTSMPTPISTPTPSPEALAVSTASPSPSLTPTPMPSLTPAQSTPPSSTSAVVINEIGWMGTVANASDEWIELYNITNMPVSLDGWILISETDSSPNIVLSGTISAFGFYLIERTDDDTISDITADFKGSFGTGGLKNTGEKLILKDENGNVQDMVDNSSGWHAGIASPDYKSMERIDPKQSGNDAANWGTNNGLSKNGLDAANNQINGTPKNQNSVHY